MSTAGTELLMFCCPTLCIWLEYISTGKRANKFLQQELMSLCY